MNELSMREEYLASFCFATEGETEAELARLGNFAAGVDATFLHWEFVYVLTESDRARAAGLSRLLAQSKNLRLIVVKDDMSFYRRRAIAVSEAIGDVVVLTSFAELDDVAPMSFADQAYATGQIVLGCQRPRLSSASILHHLLTLLSSHRINAADLKTIAVPRVRLNKLLLRPTLALDLRFEPKAGTDTYTRKVVRTGRSRSRQSAIGDRYELLEELVRASAPRMLRVYAGLCTVVFSATILYALYAVAVLAIKTDVQPGWFSTAIVQAGSVGFIAVGMAVISIGIADVAERLSERSRHVIVDEIANIDFFDRTREINVHLSAPVDTTSE